MKLKNKEIAKINIIEILNELANKMNPSNGNWLNPIFFSVELPKFADKIIESIDGNDLGNEADDLLKDFSEMKVYCQDSVTKLSDPNKF